MCLQKKLIEGHKDQRQEDYHMVPKVGNTFVHWSVFSIIPHKGQLQTLNNCIVLSFLCIVCCKRRNANVKLFTTVQSFS